MSTNVVSLNNVSFGYLRQRVFENLTMEIEAKKITVITGVNGSGKSTLLNLMLGFLKPQNGFIELLGENVKDFKAFGRLGYVPQGGLLNVSSFPATVMEVLLLKLKPHSLFGYSNEQKKHVLDSLEHVGMKGFEERLIGSLSGGQLQRILIARELLTDPEVLFLDEPTAGLDRKSIEALNTLLIHLNEVHHMTIIMVTHQQEINHPNVKHIEVVNNGVKEDDNV